MKRYKMKILIAIAALTVLLTANVTFAWFSLGSNTLSPQINGGVLEEYFHCGSGTEEDPFVITRPTHYYHMVEFFQRTTALPVTSEGAEAKDALFGNDYLYFQLGYPLDENSPDKYYVYDYNDDGTYNIDSEGNPELSRSLNMNCYSDERALMPLGSSEVPFYGLIDGKGIDVEKLHIVSESTVNLKKTETDETVSIKRTTSDIGVFGYVGKGTDENKTTIKNVYFSSINIDLTELKVGIYGDKNNVSDTHDDSQHNKDTDEETAYVGYIAGHVYTTTYIQNVYVNDCEVFGGATAKDGFGLFGYVCDPDGKEVESLGDYVKNLSAGDENEWGGSIDMKGLYERTDYFYKNNKEQYGTGYRYRNDLEGSFYYGTYTDYSYSGNVGEGIIYLEGGRIVSVTESEPKDTGEVAFYIYSGSNYLSISGTSIINVNKNTEDLKDEKDRTYPVTWSFSEEGYIYTYRDSKKYYLTGSYWSLSVSDVASTVWILDKEYDSSNDVGYAIKYQYGSSSTTGVPWYSNMYFSNSKWSCNINTSMTIYLSAGQNERWVLNNKYEYEDKDAGSLATYIPLNVNGTDDNGNIDYSVNKTKNTGYILSGCDNTGGDIRLTRRTISSTLGNSVNGTYGEGENGKVTIYTYSEKEGHTSVSDLYNSADGNTLGLKRYEYSKIKGLDALLGGNEMIYGMHFMGASISKSKIVTVPKAYILNNEHDNYQMPADSIDFRVANRGYINFFAGTFYGSEKNFFSLHSITRGSDNSITAIKEISKIYSISGSADYVYQYTDESYSASVTGKTLNLEFDCDWITNPDYSIKYNAIYYFEIPVNAGEFALGSCGSGDGAYLLYLDIGANGGGEGNIAIGDKNGHTLSASFVNIDYRSQGGVSEDALMQFSVVAPETTNDNFSLKVVFESNDADCDGYGIYKIYVKNKTAIDINLIVCMFDNDNDKTNAYEFGYQIIYYDDDGNETVYKNGDKNYFQTANSFKIGSGGVSVE